MHKRGSLAWLMVTQTATHLRDQATLLSSEDALGDKNFSLVVHYAINYWNVKASLLSAQLRVPESSIHGWAVTRNLPPHSVRKTLVEYIRHDLLTRARDIQTVIEQPTVKVPA